MAISDTRGRGKTKRGPFGIDGRPFSHTEGAKRKKQFAEIEKVRKAQAKAKEKAKKKRKKTKTLSK